MKRPNGGLKVRSYHMTTSPGSGKIEAVEKSFMSEAKGVISFKTV